MSDTKKEETASSKNNEGEREFVHPLQKNDPVLVKHVDFVTLEFLELAKHPIPKNQLLNKQEAFGELTGRCILVALSHGWFYQMHPDPHAVKIDIIVKEFGFEYQADAAITVKYGSDKLPFMSFGGVMLHEICLSVMITSIKKTSSCVCDTCPCRCI